MIKSIKAFDDNVEALARRDDQVVPVQEVEVGPMLAYGKQPMCKSICVSENTLDRLVAHEGFPCVKVGGKNLYPIHLVREWLEVKAKESK